MTDKEIVNAIRSETPDDTELTESLKLGWLADLPAIQDENGITLVGNRRMRIAAALNITPVIKQITVGTGDVADALRFRLAYASNIGGKSITPAERKKLAIYLYQQRQWTQQRIADALGVSQQMAAKYLRELIYNRVVNQNHVKTSTNPKGSGRPKGSTKPKPVPQPQPVSEPVPHKYDRAIEDNAATLHLDEGKSIAEAATIAGVSEQVVIKSVARERGRREVLADPPIDPATLTPNQQARLTIAINNHKKKLEAEFRPRVDADLKRMLALRLPAHIQLVEDATRILNSRRGILSQENYNKLRRALHADMRMAMRDRAKRGVEDDASVEKLFNDLFNEITRQQVVFRNELPTPVIPYPRTLEELLQAKARVTAENKAKRAAAKAAKEATPTATDPVQD